MVAFHPQPPAVARGFGDFAEIFAVSYFGPELARALWNFDEFGPSQTANEVVKAMQSVLDGTYRKVGSSGPHLTLIKLVSHNVLISRCF